MKLTKETALGMGAVLSIHDNETNLEWSVATMLNQEEYLKT